MSNRYCPGQGVDETLVEHEAVRTEDHLVGVCPDLCRADRTGRVAHRRRAERPAGNHPQ
jgi:hypothetical protein